MFPRIMYRVREDNIRRSYTIVLLFHVSITYITEKLPDVQPVFFDLICDIHLLRLVSRECYYHCLRWPVEDVWITGNCTVGWPLFGIQEIVIATSASKEKYGVRFG
jgi:hypothetical protein